VGRKPHVSPLGVRVCALLRFPSCLFYCFLLVGVSAFFLECPSLVLRFISSLFICRVERQGSELWLVFWKVSVLPLVACYKPV